MDENLFLVFLGMTYLLLAKLVEAAIFSNIYF